jgi:hypothetical protein
LFQAQQVGFIEDRVDVGKDVFGVADPANPAPHLDRFAEIIAMGTSAALIVGSVLAALWLGTR